VNKLRPFAAAVKVPTTRELVQNALSTSGSAA
jgi:hypothetical protein